MANPQKENGYTPIANEILEQICRLKLNGTQFKIIILVWRYTYGFSRKQHDLSESFIAKATNTHKIQLSKEINKLIDQKIIRVIKEATFTTPRIITFNKDYSKWIDRQLVNSLTPNENDYTTVSEITNTTVSESTNQDKQSLKQSLKKDICNFQQIIDMYNEICISYPRVTKLSDTRKKTIKARFNTYKEDDFKILFQMAEDSDFLKGKNNRDWRATLDWLIKDSNMAKVLDGNYSKKGSVASGQQFSDNGFGHVKTGSELMEEIERNAEARGESCRSDAIDDIFK